MKLKPTGWLVLLAAQAMMLSGCATKAVWKEGQFARYHEPAPAPDIRLFRSSQGQDVLVEYNESNEGDESIRRRAYWLHENQERLNDHRKPRFVSIEQEQGLVSIPILKAPAVPDPSLAGGLYAVASSKDDAFTLDAAGKEEGPMSCLFMLMLPGA